MDLGSGGQLYRFKLLSPAPAIGPILQTERGNVMAKLYHWIAKHQSLSFLLFTVVSCALCSLFLLWLDSPIWLIQLLDVLLIFANYRYTALCPFNLLRKASAELEDKCDPYPLLQETETLFSYPHKNGIELNLLINHNIALSMLGEHRKVYENLTAIDIDQYIQSPSTQFVYYNNLLACCDDLGMSEQVEQLIPKVMQLYAEIEDEKQKQRLEQTVWSLKVSEYMLRQEYTLALEILNGMKPVSLRSEVGNAMLRAKVYLALDETEQAKEQLRFVIDHGNKLWLVTEARQLLENCTKQEVKQE